MIANKKIFQNCMLAHNLKFKSKNLFYQTNRKYLHFIKQDKRNIKEKNEDEMINNCERISFTFRTINTFIDGSGNISGQGARKDLLNAINGLTETSDELAMLKAFSEENHQANFDWHSHYSQGFNSINFKIESAHWLRFQDDTWSICRYSHDPQIQ